MMPMLGAVPLDAVEDVLPRSRLGLNVSRSLLSDVFAFDGAGRGGTVDSSLTFCDLDFEFKNNEDDCVGIFEGAADNEVRLGLTRGFSAESMSFPLCLLAFEP